MTTYPPTRREDLVEVLHGHEIADPYRWLEDPDSAETKAWVRAQNAVTQELLGALPDRAAWTAAVRELVLRPTVGAPVRRGGWYLVARNPGDAPQATWYAARDLAELEEGGGRVLLDPSSWSPDGSASLNAMGMSGDGRLLAYAVSEGGSDWQRLRVLDVERGEDLDEPEVISRFTSPVWLPDHRSYLYLRYDVATAAEGTETGALPAPDLVLRTVGTRREEDRVVLALEPGSHQMTWPSLSDDRRWLAVTVTTGTERANDLLVARLDVQEGRAVVGPLHRLTAGPQDMVSLVDVVDDVAYLLTDRDAPRNRLVRVDLGALEAGTAPADLEWVDVLPEQEGTLGDVVLVGDRLVTERLVDATPVVTRHELDGTVVGVVDVPAGVVLGLDGHRDGDELLLTVNSAADPSSSYVVSASTGRTRRLRLRRDEPDLPEVVVERLRATSTDGTEVPYWLMRRADAPDGPAPTLVYGYGGFDVPLFSTYVPMHLAWVAAGGQAVVANLRGGGEFGRAWYEDGRRERKQHVFDDCAAVARDLVDRGRTAPDRLAVHGASNGGLLVGAMITQQPHLFAAAAPEVGVLDMLRFHRFTMGAAWISDYGDPDVAEDFEVALAYSPLHNVHEGERYPATIVVTGDHDDRVVPAHSHKFTATLQHAQAGDAPVVTRVETSTGHGAGKPRAVAAQEMADILAFLAHHTGLRHP